MHFVDHLIIITSVFYSHNFSFLFIPVHVGPINFTLKPFLLVLAWLLLRSKIRKENLLIFILFAGFCLMSFIFSSHKKLTELNILFSALILLVMPSMKLKDIIRASNIAVIIIFVYVILPRSHFPFIYLYSFSTPLTMLLPFVLCGLLQGDKFSDLAFIVGTFSIFSTLSKSCWIVFPMSVLLFFVIKGNLKIFVKSVFTAFIISILFVPGVVETFLKFNKSLFIRMDIWEQSLKYVSFIGQGLGHQEILTNGIFGMHNTFLEALISGGIIGFIFYISAILLIFKRLLKNGSLLSVACLVSLISWCFHGMFQIVMNEYVFWVVAGIALTINDMDPELQKET